MAGRRHTSIGITVAALAVIFRRSLRGRYTSTFPVGIPDRGLLGLAMALCGLLGPAFAAGIDVTWGSSVAALVLVVACLLRAPHLLSWRLLPWPLVLGVGVLFIVVQVAHDHGLAQLLSRAAGTGGDWAQLLRLAGVAALGANLVDNLPSYLAMEPVASGSSIRMAGLLVGVNAGPLITPWASLATLLWASRCRSAGVTVSWPTFALRGLVLVPLVLVGSVTALALVAQT